MVFRENMTVRIVNGADTGAVGVVTRVEGCGRVSAMFPGVRNGRRRYARQVAQAFIAPEVTTRPAGWWF